jgi:nucleotide-binding universal stress UspA family protein
MAKLFENIFCPIDFSDYSILALRYASALAIQSQARLVVYHSVPDLEQVSNYLEGHYIRTVTDALLTSGREKLEEFCTKILPPDLQPVLLVGSGNSAEMILQVSKQECADLIVMGTHGYSGYHRFLLGSVTNKVLHGAAIPVLTVCKPQHNFLQSNVEHPIGIRRILCAVDLEPNNKRIIAFASAMAMAYDSEIYFLHVNKVVDGVDWFLKEDRMLKRLRELVAPVQNELKESHFLIESGQPSIEILKAIERHGIDLVIMGHHTRKPVEEYLLGSITKGVIPDAACPILVVRSEADLIYGQPEVALKQDTMIK